MTIPEVRIALLILANEMAQYPYTKPFADTIRALVKELYRRRGLQPTKVRSQPITPELKAHIRRYKRSHPDMSLQQIANRFTVNQGRVTDAILGKRK